MQANTFDEILGLEERFYDEGYQQGLSDGIKAGRIEGRTFGLEKGFEKYVEIAKLHGKSIVWANRIQPSSSRKLLPRLPGNQRLAKHIKVLHALAESESLSTENSEEAVSNFDDRLKRAQGKAKVMERMLGNGKWESTGQGQGQGQDEEH